MLSSLTLGEIAMAPCPQLATAGEEQTKAVAEALSGSGRGGRGDGGGGGREEKFGVIPSKPEGALSCHSDSWDAQVGQSWSSVSRKR